MSMGGSSTNEVTMYLVLKEDKKLNNEQLEKEILKRTKGVDGCEVAVSTSNMDMSALGGSGLQVEIKGKDLEQLQEIATDLAGKIEKVKGTQNVYDGLEETDAQYKVVVDKSKAMRYGLTVAQVFQEINKKIAEATSATTISTATKDYDVYVRSEKDESLTREQLADISIQTTNAEGETEEIKVGDIATFEDSVSPQAINRDSQSRYMSVTAEIASGYNIGLVSQDVQKILDKYNVPEGYTIEMKGEDESINEAMGRLLQMLALALVFMYLICHAVRHHCKQWYCAGGLHQPAPQGWHGKTRGDRRGRPCPSAPHRHDSTHHHFGPSHHGYGHGNGRGYGAANGDCNNRRFDLRYTADTLCRAVYL